MSTEDKAAKIAALLAKAERTDNPHEAETFQAAAERLMLKWGIEEAVAKGHMPGQDEIIEASLRLVGPQSRTFVTFCNRITVAFGLRGYFITLPDKNHLWYVVGFKSDVEKALWLMMSLQVQASHALETWWSSEGKAENEWRSTTDRREVRKAFIVAFGNTVGKRIHESRKAMIDETPGAALVLASREDRVKDFMGQNHSDLRGARTKERGSVAGTAAGNRADLGEGRLAGRIAIG